SSGTHTAPKISTEPSDPNAFEWHPPDSFAATASFSGAGAFGEITRKIESAVFRRNPPAILRSSEPTNAPASKQVARFFDFGTSPCGAPRIFSLIIALVGAASHTVKQ